jgi:hypothetical protein
MQLQRACHDTLPWLICFSLGGMVMNSSGQRGRFPADLAAIFILPVVAVGLGIFIAENRWWDLIGIGISLIVIAIIGFWLLVLPWTSKYRRSSRWFRDAAVFAGLAAVASSSVYALLVFDGHSFSPVTFLEMKISAPFAFGMWIGLSLSLFHSSEFWEPRRPSPLRTWALKSRKI